MRVIKTILLLLRQMASGKYAQRGVVSLGNIAANGNPSFSIRYNHVFENTPHITFEVNNNRLVVNSSAPTPAGCDIWVRNVASTAANGCEVKWRAVDDGFLERLFGGGALLKSLPAVARGCAAC